MRTGRSALGVAAATGGFIYAGGGALVSGDTDAFEQYDVVAGTWRVRARLPSARRGLALVANGGPVFAIGGCQGFPCIYLSDVHQYDPPTDSWLPRASMPTARARLGAARATNGRIYAAGGMGASGYVQTVEGYDPATDSWRTLRSLPTPRYGLAVVASPDSRVFAIGGADSTGALARVDAYDPISNTWQT
jgi:N-acetylneuraminic acid mutarotase